MGLRSKTFFVYKGEGGLQEARYFLRNAVGFNGELILRMEGVLFQPDVVHLTIYYLDQEDYAVKATAPGPGAFIGTGTTVEHLSVLFSDKIESSSITASGFTFDDIGLPAGDIYLESNKYIARVRLTGSTVNQSGFHSLQIDSSKLKYTNGQYIQNSAVVGYSKAPVNAAYPGEAYPYSANRGRRGEVDIAGVIVSKNTPPNEIIDAFIRQSNISKDRIITSTTVSLNNGNLYCFFTYFRTLEPQVIYYFPYNYSLALDINGPNKLTVVFREPIDKYQVTSESGLFQIATGWNGTSGIAPSQISVERDNKTVHISTSSFLAGQGIYDLRILGVKSLDGTIKTYPDIYNILVGPFSEPGAAFTGNITAQTVFAGSGLTGIGNYIHVKYDGEGSITGDLEGIRVQQNSITTSHVRDGSLTSGDLNFHMVTTIRDSLNNSTSGHVKFETIIGGGYGIFGVSPGTVGFYFLQPLIVSGKSGIAFDSYTQGALVNAIAVAANNTVSISDNGIGVGVIGTGNISGAAVVRSIRNDVTTLRDDVYFSGRGSVTLIPNGNGFFISGSATAGTALGRSGIITDPVDPSYLRISGHDNSIGFVGDGVRVNLIGSGNISGNAVNTFTIADNTVVRSITNSATTLRDSIYVTGRGTVSVTIENNGFILSGAAGAGIVGGNSGVIVDPVNSSLLRVSGADNSIGFIGDGIRVNLIGSGNISGNAITGYHIANASVVRSIINGATTLQDSIYLTGLSGVNLTSLNNGFQLGAVAANSSITVSAGGIAVGAVGPSNFSAPYPISGIRVYDSSTTLIGVMSGWVGEIKIGNNLGASFDSTNNRLTITYAPPAGPDSTPSYIEAFLFGG